MLLLLKTVHWIEKREVSAGDPTNGVAMGEQLRDWQQGRKNQRLRWACLVFRKSRVAATNNNEGYQFHLCPKRGCAYHLLLSKQSYTPLAPFFPKIIPTAYSSPLANDDDDYYYHISTNPRPQIPIRSSFQKLFLTATYLKPHHTTSLYDR